MPGHNNDRSISPHPLIRPQGHSNASSTSNTTQQHQQHQQHHPAAPAAWSTPSSSTTPHHPLIPATPALDAMALFYAWKTLQAMCPNTTPPLEQFIAQQQQAHQQLPAPSMTTTLPPPPLPPLAPAQGEGELGQRAHSPPVSMMFGGEVPPPPPMVSANDSRTDHPAVVVGEGHDLPRTSHNNAIHTNALSPDLHNAQGHTNAIHLNALNT